MDKNEKSSVDLSLLAQFRKQHEDNVKNFRKLQKKQNVEKRHSDLMGKRKQQQLQDASYVSFSLQPYVKKQKHKQKRQQEQGEMEVAEEEEQDDEEEEEDEEETTIRAELKKPYLRVSSQMQVHDLKEYLALKLGSNAQANSSSSSSINQLELSIMFRGKKVKLEDRHTLKLICRQLWDADCPLEIFYN